MIPITYNHVKGIWDLHPATDKVVAPSDIDDTIFPLKLKPRRGADHTQSAISLWCSAKLEVKDAASLTKEHFERS